MTVQEAIRELHYIRESFAIDANSFEALDMAIEALSETKRDLSEDDSISRQDAIDAASEGCFELRGIFQEIRDRIMQLPSAEPEPSQCWRCNCPKIQKTFSEMVHLHDAEDGGGA